MSNAITEAWELGGDICPPYWPRWCGIKWPPRPPKGLEKFEQIHLALTIHELAEQLKDAQLSKGIQGLTKTALSKQMEGIS